jgi:hypothetical protein
VGDTPTLVASAEDPVSPTQQMKRAMDCKAELRRVFREFAPTARDRYGVRQTAAAMERVFIGFMQGRKSARALLGETELPHAT